MDPLAINLRKKTWFDSASEDTVDSLNYENSLFYDKKSSFDVEASFKKISKIDDALIPKLLSLSPPFKKTTYVETNSYIITSKLNNKNMKNLIKKREDKRLPYFLVIALFDNGIIQKFDGIKFIPAYCNGKPITLNKNPLKVKTAKIYQIDSTKTAFQFLCKLEEIKNHSLTLSIKHLNADNSPELSLSKPFQNITSVNINTDIITSKFTKEKLINLIKKRKELGLPYILALTLLENGGIEKMDGIKFMRAHFNGQSFTKNESRVKTAYFYQINQINQINNIKGKVFEFLCKLEKIRKDNDHFAKYLNACDPDPKFRAIDSFYMAQVCLEGKNSSKGKVLIKQDLDQAVSWLKVSADDGYFGAHLQLSNLYKDGDIVKKSYDKYLKHLDLAYQTIPKDHMYAEMILDELKEEKSPPPAPAPNAKILRNSKKDLLISNKTSLSLSNVKIPRDSKKDLPISNLKDNKPLSSSQPSQIEPRTLSLSSSLPVPPKKQFES